MNRRSLLKGFLGTAGALALPAVGLTTGEEALRRSWAGVPPRDVDPFGHEVMHWNPRYGMRRGPALLDTTGARIEIIGPALPEVMS